MAEPLLMDTCPGCGYDVRGVARIVCPECGADLRRRDHRSRLAAPLTMRATLVCAAPPVAILVVSLAARMSTANSPMRPVATLLVFVAALGLGTWQAMAFARVARELRPLVGQRTRAWLWTPLVLSAVVGWLWFWAILIA